MSNLPSPIPSPDINAPSPESDNDDFDLPADVNFYNANGTFGSFLSDGPLPFDVNEFYRESPPLAEHNQSIQVIQSQEQQLLPTAPLNDFYNSIMPPKMEAYNPALGYNDSYRQQQPPLPSTAPPMNFICTAPPPPPPTSQNNNNQSLNSSNNGICITLTLQCHRQIMNEKVTMTVALLNMWMKAYEISRAH